MVKRVRLEYGDHNEEFGSLLPQEGTIERFVSSAEGDRWVLLRLDTPIQYDVRTYE